MRLELRLQLVIGLGRAARRPERGAKALQEDPQCAHQ
jgi:hypothetical protein